MEFDASGWLDVAKHDQTGNRDQVQNTREVVVLHYTAGYDLASAVRHFKNTNAEKKASAHFVIGLDGDIVQLVSTNEVSWHAGRGIYRGVRGSFNRKSIGIEIVNPGYLRKRPDGTFEDWNGRTVSSERLAAFPGLTEAADPWVGSRPVFWPNFPEKQLDATEKLVRALLRTYASVDDIVGHRDVDPEEKLRVDPGKAFPMRRFRMLLADPRGDRNIRQGRVNVSANSVLFVRGGPGTSFDKLDWGPLNRGDTVDIIAESGDWYQVRVPGDGGAREGWCYALYIERV